MCGKRDNAFAAQTGSGLSASPTSGLAPRGPGHGVHGCNQPARPGPAALMLDAPAKLNLFLQVTGKRTDGYHELISLMCPIALVDRIGLTLGGEGIALDCSDPDIPADSRNLAHRAAIRFYDAIGRCPGVSITIQKKIPAGAGLGGGSSDAAAVLRGLNQLSGHPLGLPELMEIALDIGADVPFFILGQPAVARGIGEHLTPYLGLLPLWFLVIFPGVWVSTAQVYKKLNLRLTNCKKNSKNFSFDDQDFDFRRHLCNDLQPTAQALCPDIARVAACLAQAGGQSVLMSGSGSAVFAAFETMDAARNVDARVAAEGAWRRFLVGRFAAADTGRLTIA
jgi:4-diphosphocytidyl-2-C-methyl-D-erythritol kinase